MKNIILVSFSCFCSIIAQAIPNHNNDKNIADTNKMLAGSHASLLFIENKGQITDQNHNARPDIDFSVKAAPELNILIGSGAIHYQFSKSSNANTLLSRDNTTLPLSREEDSGRISPLERGRRVLTHDTFSLYRMDVTLIGANKNAQHLTEEQQDYYENHITPDNINKGGGVCHAYTRITYKDIYPHIDWVLYIKASPYPSERAGERLEHEFIIHEGGNPADIRLQYGGATNLDLNTDGSLTATTPQGTITEHAPTSYQADGTPIKTNFILIGDVISYET